jgi:hypothetical protein
MADKARRKRRLVRAGVAAVILVSTSVAIAIAVSRHQAVLARQRAVAEAQRAEASKLLALALLKLRGDPTEALAYATASLDLADTKDARVTALRALSEAPPAWELVSGIRMARRPVFSPDGRRLAVAGFSTVVGVWDDNGSPPVHLAGHETSPRGGTAASWVSNYLLVTGLSWEIGRQVHVWSLPGGTKLRMIDFGAPSLWQVGPGRLFAQTPVAPSSAPFLGGGLLRSWQMPDGEPEVLGRIDAQKLGSTSSLLEPHGRAWLYTKGKTTHLVPLPVGSGRDRVLSRHGADVSFLSKQQLEQQLDRDLLTLHSEAGENQLLLFPDTGPPIATDVPKPDSAPASVFAERSGRWLHNVPFTDARLRLWDAGAFPGGAAAGPAPRGIVVRSSLRLRLRRSDRGRDDSRPEPVDVLGTSRDLAERGRRAQAVHPRNRLQPRQPLACHQLGRRSPSALVGARRRCRSRQGTGDTTTG